MNKIGFSTGSIAKGDFSKALAILSEHAFEAVELSALRLSELPILIESLGDLDLSSYRYVSLHAPSEWPVEQEPEILSQISRGVKAGYPVVVHPDSVNDWSAWADLGSSILVENMDRRKRTGRTVGELRSVFDRLPEARMCLDLAHVKQVDPTLVEGYWMLKEFGDRIAQIHISDLRSDGKHVKMTFAAQLAYRQLLGLFNDYPVIIESPVEEHEIASESAIVGTLFSKATSGREKLGGHQWMIGLGVTEDWGRQLAGMLRRNGCYVYWLDQSNRTRLSENELHASSILALSSGFCERESDFVRDIGNQRSTKSFVLKFTCKAKETDNPSDNMSHEAVSRTADTLLEAVARRDQKLSVTPRMANTLKELYIRLP